MTLVIQEIDYGTPARRHRRSTVTLDHRRRRRHRAGGHLDHARGDGGRHQDPEALRHRHASTPSAPAASAWSRSRAARGTPASCTTPVAPGMVVHDPDRAAGAAAPRRDGALHLRPSARLPDLRRQRRLRAAGHGGRGRPARGALRLRRRQPPRRPAKDESNPYFTFDPSKCIVCSRCVRACEEVQGTFALTIEGRGFDSQVVAPAWTSLPRLRMRLLRRLRAGLPDRDADREVRHRASASRSTRSSPPAPIAASAARFKAEMRGDELVRMVPYKDGKANHGHSCVKGRFAWGYATHKDRILKPMIREKITDPWREVSLGRGDRPRRRPSSSASRRKYGRDSIGGITSSRCTNEETYLVQKLVRAGFGNNNVDTCARVCHSPTGYGLKTTFGTSAGTQDFDSVEQADVIMVIGANPTDGHPVFASRMKKRLREGAKLIVIDPRRIDLVRTPHVEADYHLPLRPGTNVAVLNALAHVIVTEGLVDEAFVARALRPRRVRGLGAPSSPSRATRPEAVEPMTGVPAADDPRAPRGSTPPAATARSTTASASPSTARARPWSWRIANLAMATGNIGRARRRREPAARPEQRAGRLRHGLLPARVLRLPPRLRRRDARDCSRALWGVALDGEPGLRIPNMLDAAVDGTLQGPLRPGRGHRCSPIPNTQHVDGGAGGDGMRRRAGPVPERDRELRPCLPAGLVLPGEGRHLHQRRAPHQPRAQGDGAEGRHGRLGGDACALANALGYAMDYSHPVRDHGRDRAADADLRRRLATRSSTSWARVQWPCNEKAPDGHADHAYRRLRARQGPVHDHRISCRPTSAPARASRCCSPPAASSSQYNVGAQTRRTENVVWHEEDVLEIHPHDAEKRGVRDGDWVALASRAGETTLRAAITERVQPGVVYTTFHHPETRRQRRHHRVSPTGRPTARNTR